LKLILKGHSNPVMRLKLLLLAVIVAVLTYLGRHTEIDDALIYARYIGNALAGKGLVFNVGENVNALTSPLFAYLLLGISWLLKGQVLLATILLSAIFFFGAAALAERLVPFAGFLVASTSYFYTLVGMETALFLFMLMLALTLYLDGKDQWIPVVSLLLILTRFEGAAMVLFIAIGMYRTRRFPTWSSFVPAIAVLAAYLFLNYHWYGHIVPSSATSKIGQGMSGLWGRWPTAFLGCSYQLKGDFLPMIYIVPLIGVGAFYSLWRYRNEPMDRLIFAFSALGLAFYILFNIPGYRWYFAPFIFFGMVCACQSMPKTRNLRLGSAAIIGLVLATSVHTLYRTPFDPQGGYMGLAAWLNENTSSDSRVAASETGTVGWYSNRYIIDIIGLTTPKNAAHIARRDTTSWLAEDRPDYIIVHDMDWVWERVAKESPDYLPAGPHFGNAYILERKGLPN
jgi:arabinofuranosyltransferase